MNTKIKTNTNTNTTITPKVATEITTETIAKTSIKANTQETKYDYSKFTREDEKMYREILESEPYDPELEKAFHEFYRNEDRFSKACKRHIDSFDEIDFNSYECEAPNYESQVEMKMLCEELLGTLNDIERQLIELVYFYGFSQKEAYRQLNISQSKASKTIKAALLKMRKYAEMNGIVKDVH